MKLVLQLGAGVAVLGVVAAVIGAMPTPSPGAGSESGPGGMNALACLGMLLVGVGVFTEARRRRVAQAGR